MISVIRSRHEHMTMNQYKLSSRAIAFMAAILLLFASRLGAQTYTLSPPPFLEVRTLAGAIIPNGCVWTYAAGTTTPIATYSDTTGVVNGNPIVSDSYGRFVAYLLPGTNYKFVYEATPCSAPSTHGTVLRTQDNIQGLPGSSNNVDIGGTAGEALSAGQCAYLSDGSGSKTVGQWYKCDSANAYSSTLPTIGIPIAAIASATTGTFRIAGSVTGLSSLTSGAPYYVSGTAGSLTTTAPSFRRFVGTADSTTSIVVSANPASFVWAVITSTATGTQTAFAPGVVGPTLVRLNNASLTTIATLLAGYDGQEVEFVSIGAGQVDINDSAAALGSAADRIVTGTGGTISLAAGFGRFKVRYDMTTARWRVLWHEQGASVAYTPTVGGAGGTAIGNGTIAGAYLQVGKRVYFQIAYTLGTTSAVGTSLTFTLPITSSVFGAQASDLIAVDLSATSSYVGGIINSSTTVIQAVTTASPVTAYATAVPFTWATGDSVAISGWYFAQ